HVYPDLVVARAQLQRIHVVTALRPNQDSQRITDVADVQRVVGVDRDSRVPVLVLRFSRGRHERHIVNSQTVHRHIKLPQRHVHIVPRKRRLTSHKLPTLLYSAGVDGAPWVIRTGPAERSRVVGADGLPAGTVVVPGSPWAVRWDAERVTISGVSAALTTLAGAAALPCDCRGVVATICGPRTGDSATRFRLNTSSSASARGDTPSVNGITVVTMWSATAPAPIPRPRGISAQTSASGMSDASVSGATLKLRAISAETLCAARAPAPIPSPRGIPAVAWCSACVPLPSSSASGISAAASASSTGENGMPGPGSVEGLEPPESVSPLPEWSVVSATSNGYQARR